MVPKKSTLGKFAYISHFQGIGISEAKFEKREFILKVTISLPSLSSMLKLPNRELKNYDDGLVDDDRK